MPNAALTSSTVRDNRKNNTLAHEIGHMLFNGPVIHMQDPGDDAPPTDMTNLMFTTDAAAPPT